MKIFSTAALAAVLLAGTASVAVAQDAPLAPPEEPTADGNGAQVLRETADVTEEVLDAEGNPVLDEEGNPVVEVTGSVSTQTVTTPSGNVNTQTRTFDADGNQTGVDVTHEQGDHGGGADSRAAAGSPPERPDRPTQPERPDRPDQPERPDRPDRPDRPERPDRPDRPDRPN